MSPNDIAKPHLPSSGGGASCNTATRPEPSSRRCPIQPFGEDYRARCSALTGAIINARVAEIFELILKEIKRSGYDGLMKAGIVLTGGSSLLPGIKTVAADVLKMPVRVAQPEHITGMAEALKNPSYSTSVGLLKLGLIMDLEDDRRKGLGANGSKSPRPDVGAFLRRALGRLLPGEEG